MRQPLVSRPPYGGNAPKATAQLPSGGPTDRGLPVDDGIQGYKTFSKPEDDLRKPDPKDESIYRIDGPDDLAKDRNQINVRDLTDTSPSYFGLGDKDPQDYSKTKYPYRDDKPNSHNASEFLTQLHLLSKATPLVLQYQECSAERVAATAEQILSGLNPKFRARSQTVAVTLKRADIKNMRWIFSVKGDHVHAVKIRAIRPRNTTTKLSKMDLELSCSCPAWQWQGPEFHSTRRDYQLGKPVGTATPPDIRDPHRQNFVCKHVAAVLEATKTWEIPTTLNRRTTR